MKEESMQALQQKAKELLESGTVNVIIGYGRGSRDRVRPVFVRHAADATKLIWDQRCRQNLAVYLSKPEIKTMGTPAIVATPATVRSLIQLTAERQTTAGKFIVLAPEQETVTVLTDSSSVEAYAAGHPVVFPPHVNKKMEALDAMTLQERFSFWQDEFSRCFKCYACRSACPLCYCERCVTECNQPRWVQVAPHPQGNFEWHLNRAMHLAGRCVECGSCTIACPAGIPIGLLTIEASRIVEREFGQRAGMRCDSQAALSSFRVEDKESFIQ
jgi:ferredoxin